MDFLGYIESEGYPKILLDDVVKHIHQYTYTFYVKGKLQIAPKWQLKIIQKIIQKYLSINYAKDHISENATAYIKGKNISYNVDRHQGNNYFFASDFKNFFPSIDKDSVMEMLTKILHNESQESLTCISNIIFYNGRLQYGFPTSPIISNLIMKQFDDELQNRLDIKYSMKIPKYSRYSDDIAISSKYKIEKNEILTEIEGLISELYPYLKINDKKTRVFEKYSNKPYITGLVPLNNRNTIGRKKYNEIKLNILLLIKGIAINNHEFCKDAKSMSSYLSYLYNVDKHNYNRMKMYFCKKYNNIDILKTLFPK